MTALIGSLFFYFWGAPTFVGVLLAVSWLDWMISWRIHRCEVGSKARKNWVTGGIVINLGMLAYFKYSNFFVGEVNALANSWLGNDFFTWATVIMPIGISFVVFEEISYMLDVYRGISKPAQKFSTYALFLFLFPHSIAGPIFRWHDLEAQLTQRTHSVDKAFNGVTRFLLGLAKKVLIADQMAIVADLVFSQGPSTLPASYAWVGMVAYTFQIYFDFSAYSDMAIGIGAVLGFRFKENFNAPYIASSITDFWRRWHISLSTWMRDYLYIPLGGNRISGPRTYLNLGIVFLLSGFWHGASWTFVAWGAYHGILLILDRVLAERKLVPALPRAATTLFTLFLVMVGWVLFRSPSIGYAVQYVGRLFAFFDQDAYLRTSVSMGELLSHRSAFVLIVASAICLAPYFGTAREFFLKFMGIDPSAEKQGVVALARYGCAMVLFFFVVLSLVTSGFSPFIYFRF